MYSKSAPQGNSGSDQWGLQGRPTNVLAALPSNPNQAQAVPRTGVLHTGFTRQWRIQGGGDGSDHPPRTCPNPENLCRVCVTGADRSRSPPPPPWNVDDVTQAIFWRADDVMQTKSKGGGVLVKMFSRQRVMMSRGQCPRGVVLVNVCTRPLGNPVSVPARDHKMTAEGGRIDSGGKQKAQSMKWLGRNRL